MLANAGVPMLALHLPTMVVLLVPIIAIEAVVGRCLLTLPTSRLVRGVAGANVASTLLGIPLTWGFMVVLNIATTGGTVKGLDTLPGLFASVILQSSWLVPYEEDLDWLIPAATLVLLLAYYPVTAVIERFALKKIWKAEVPSHLWRYVWLANGLTYGMLALGTGVLLWRAL